ncbi:MAG TPA: hypothetical protein V6C65_41520, partial [Allocoleopsis sp.]
METSQYAIAEQETTFNQLVAALLAELRIGEDIKLQLIGEQSQFVRFNHAKVRQTGCVIDGQLHLTLMHDQRSGFREIPFTGNWETDLPQAQQALKELRQDVADLPKDPYLVLPEGKATSRESHAGNLLPPEAVAESVLSSVADLDFTGFYAAGSLIRAYADSAGQKHWFAT